MTVLTQPASFSLSGNIEKFRISTTEEFSFILKKGTEEILSSVYSPGKDHLVTIDIREIVESKLSFLLKDQSEPYVQASIFADFTAVIDEKEISFRVLRGGVDRLATSAKNFVTSNFLTWQPQIKPVTYYTPEFLTYYATVDGNVCVKAYFPQEDGEVTSEIKTVYSVLAGNAYSIPVQYAVIMALFGSRYPSFYDVWVENSSGDRLTYIQRYVADGIKSEQEQWVLFENSLGGIDTFRAYGQSDFTGEHTHNIAEIDEEFSEYRIDTTRSFQKSTGYLDKNKRKWLLDFFPSKVKYIYLGNYLRPIVVTEDNTSYTDKELPSSYTFTYKYADARPYLNLLRTDQLPDELDIDIPDLGSFSIPPRIVEFPSQPLSEGVLIPVQNPYSENWATTTAGAIFAYILNNISENYDGQGGIGHIHPNLELINAISYLDGYLLINGKKIKAGWADQLSPDSSIYKMFIRKDEEDSTNFLLSLLGGTVIKKYAKFGDFVTGVLGGYIDEKGNLEMESGVFRKRLFVPEIAYNRTTYFKGRMVNSPGGGCTVLSYVDNGDGTYTITPDLTDADGLSQFVDDILTTYFVTKNSEGKLNGFEEMKFRVTAADYTAKKFTVIPRPGHSDWKPAEQMVLAQTGNFTDPERQTYILIDSVNGNNCITFFDNANTWDPEPAQMPAWFGKKKGMTVAGINADNYSAVLQNIIMTGLIFQVDEITGQTVRVPLDKGEWVAGKYAYYDRVSHNGAMWLCVDDNGTTTEPSDDNPAWLKQVAEGQKGDPGLSVIGGGHWESANTPYSANTMVTLANCVFLSKVETSNPPIRILRIKGGNFLRKKDGGYYLAGKPADWEVNEDWDMLLDGRELKGESINFLGEFATAPANPKNGDSYRNTTDRATYIYQDGRWQLMISDGKDGKDYEYIYTRGNIIDNPPAKPDSQQKDDYIPEGWTDDFVGVDADHQVEWGCKRFKENGVWSEFSTPAVVHRWSKDGENAIMADFDNEMVNAALTSDGKVVSSQTWNTTVSMWYGTEKLTLDSITCTPDTNLLCATDKNTGVVTISVSAGATLAATNTVKITIRATKNGQQYSRDLTFTVAGVRGGADGSDAVLYSIIVSATSVSKDKNGNYSVSSVSCYRQKSVGGVISTTTDGTLKYSIDGGTETTINNNTAISSGNFTKTLKFIFYVNDQIVDVETVPMLVDGKDGADGESITAAGHWESANTPYAKNSTVSFAGGSYLSKVQTSNPPLPPLRVRGGSYLRKKDGGYILSGKRSDKAVNSDWQEMTSGVEPSPSYWLDSPVSTINFTSTGTPSPSAFVVTMKQNVGGNVSDTNRFYLAARKYNGNWLAHVGATLSNQISVPATAGYTQFAVRAYKSVSDANAWNNNFVAEKGVGVANDGAIGATGATGAFPRDRGVFASGQTYVWNADYRDKVIYLIGGVYYNFLVKNYGASVTAAPTSANGDSNWEAMQKFVNIATDTLFADGANVAGFMFKNNVLKSHNDEGETLLINGVTGYFKCKNADITGVITADSGRIGPFSIASGMLSSKTLYENETNLYVGFKLSAGQIEFYNEKTFANVRIGGNTQFITIEGIKYDAGIDIQSPNAMIGMHIKTPSIPLFVEGGNIFLHPNNDSYVSLRGIVGNWRNISVSTSLNNNDDNVMFINTGNIEVTLPPDVPGHTIYFKRMSGGVRLTGGRILPAPGGQEVSYIDLDFASGFIKCMGNYWVMFYCG
ncbi:hypothetical protein [Phocaeicola vulgatus]|uniref:hypothetical protein n=2 Tax=Phocaeicola vulgatus TaxID=821 RepID=UPI001E51A90A|nr:hypothetical protein [Phocaeicola vulgatus]MDC1724639.1 hypothetical protein [Phocaeicola vulgatus]